MVYPGQNHGISKPSYLKDRYERYVAWYDRFLKPEARGDAGDRSRKRRRSWASPWSRPPFRRERRSASRTTWPKANADFVKDPDNADNIDLGGPPPRLSRPLPRRHRRLLARDRRSSPTTSASCATAATATSRVRELDKAIADLDKADELIREQSVTDGPSPTARRAAGRRPPSTLHFNVYYHLGLAYYLKGDFAKALTAYRECMKYSTDSHDDTWSRPARTSNGHGSTAGGAEG